MPGSKLLRPQPLRANLIDRGRVTKVPETEVRMEVCQQQHHGRLAVELMMEAGSGHVMCASIGRILLLPDSCPRVL